VSVTLSPFATCSLQSPVDPVAQEISDPSTVSTVPLPLTSVASSKKAGWNVAVTVVARVIDTVHVAPEMLEQPDQAFRIESGPGVAVSVIIEPFSTGSVQSPVDPVVQAIPGASTVPLPLTTAVSA
jgi:hypothetical protein